MTLETIPEFEKVANSKGVVVVKFYAKWCRSCKGMARRFIKTADAFPASKFYEIEFDASRELCKHCDIKQLPWAQMFANGEKIDSFPVSVSNLPMLNKYLEKHL